MVKNTHLLNGHMLQVHIGYASMRGNSNVYQQHNYVTEIKKTYFEIYTKEVSSSFKHLKLPTGIKIPVTLLKIVYICMTAISPNSSS